MTQLQQSLNAWDTEKFKSVFKQEVAQLSLDELPLQQALQLSSYATKDNLQVMINSTIEEKHHIIVNTGIFYSSILAGCNCSDDPTPVDLNSEYCEMRFSINKSNSDTIIHITSWCDMLHNSYIKNYWSKLPVKQHTVFLQ